MNMTHKLKTARQNTGIADIIGRSRTSKVIDFRANQKHICDFSLVRHSNPDPILHPFGYIAAFYAPDHWSVPIPS